MLRPTIYHRGAPAAAAHARLGGAAMLKPTPVPLRSTPLRAPRWLGAAAIAPAASTIATCGSSRLTTTTSRRSSTVIRRARNSSGADVPPVPAATFSPVASADALRADAEHIGDAIAQWLDEEWAPLPEHRELGRVIADSWVRLRTTSSHDDNDDVASVLLGLGSELMASFDFGPTFTNGFEVANKAIEVAMRRDGMEVCDCSGGGGGGDAQG